MKIDPRFTKDAGSEIFTGNELLVKGALETPGGVHLLTGYPGSPIAAFFDVLESLAPMLDDHGMVARLANNEAISMAMVNGAQMAGCRAMTAFKSVGMHVASDALALGVLAGTHHPPGCDAKPLTCSGGLVIVGDDPWSDSTQVPADSRYLAEHCRLPCIEPATPQEVKDWVGLGFELGRAGQIYIGYILTTNLADGGGTVDCRPNHFPAVNEKQKTTLSYVRDIEPNVEQTVLLPPRTGEREEGLAARLAGVKAAAQRLGVNRILHLPQKGEHAPIGFIAAGSAYGYLVDALQALQLSETLPILKLGLVYPVDPQIVGEFAKRCQNLVVIEERRPFVERHVLDIVNAMRQAGVCKTEVYGKRFPKTAGGQLRGIPETRGLNPSMLVELLAPLLKSLTPGDVGRVDAGHDHAAAMIKPTPGNGRFHRELERLTRTAEYDVDIPSRTPAFCPGCPHRDSSNVLLEIRRDFLDPDYMLAKHQRKPVDLVAHGDTGCYTMLMFEPNKSLMHNYSGMGLGGATGSGVDPFIDNKQLVFMGDGTFFHSGQSAISHSIKAGQDLTYIILDNKTTAMTGHQTHAGVEIDLMGRTMFAQDIERIVQAMIPKQMSKDVRIVRINPADRHRYRQLMEETLLADGVKIVIADKECGITYHRRARREERHTRKRLGFVPKKTHMNVATEVCEFCLECTTQTGCPGLKVVDTDYGPKMQTDFSWCVNDGACQRIHACPSFEEVTILRKQAPRSGDEHVNFDDLPDPPKPLHAEQDVWRCYLAGVGGMGIGTATAILVKAGHFTGYHVQFLDKKGLAIRNGGVFSQLAFTRPDPRNPATEPASAEQDDHGQPPITADDAGAPAAAQTPLGPQTPLIPYGRADLLLGVDLLEAVRALDPAHPYRVASREHTCAVVNTAKTPTILSLMGRDDFDIADLQEVMKKYTRPGDYLGFNVGDLCERVLDSKLYANIMMLGIAFQKGYLPLRASEMERAIAQVTRADVDRNLRAFKIGRKIAVRPDLFVVEQQHEFETSRRTLRRKLNTIITRRGPKRGQLAAKQFRVLMRKTFRATRGARLDDAIFRDVIIRAYDCLVWGSIDYAKRYCDRLVEVFKKDDPDKDYAVTRAVVWNLAKVMLIKDEVYCAAMLTSPDKYKRDRRRYNVNPAHGDRIIYKHHNRPEFVIFGRRICFEWKSRDWQLRIMSRMRFLRNWLPGWHQQERDFRDWYESVVDQIQFDPEHYDQDYQRWVSILRSPETVTGYREIRYPKQDAARRQAEKLLATDPQAFASDPSPPQPLGQMDVDENALRDDDRAVHLPLLSTAGV